MVAVINMPLYDSSSATTYYENYTLGSLQTISYSTHLERKPIRKIGNVNAVDYVMGPRTIAGSLIFTVYDKHFAEKIVNDAKAKYGINTNILVDDLPPFDIIVNFANEYGSKSRLTISGVRLINEGQVMSINDIFVENTYQFVATDLIYMDKDTSKISAGGRRITAGPAPAIMSGEKPKPPRTTPDIQPGGLSEKVITYPPLRGSNPIKLDHSISNVPPSSYRFEDGFQFSDSEKDVGGEMIQFVSIKAETFKYDNGYFPVKVSFEPSRDTGKIKVLDFDKNQISEREVSSTETFLSLIQGDYYLKYEDENTFSDLKFIQLRREEKRVEDSKEIIINSSFGSSSLIENIPDRVLVVDADDNIAREVRILRSNNKIENMRVGEKYFLKTDDKKIKLSTENGQDEDYKVLIERIDNSSISDSNKIKEKSMADKAYAIVRGKEKELCEGMFSLNKIYEDEFIRDNNHENEYNMRTSAKLTGMLCTIFRNRISTVNMDSIFTPDVTDEINGIIGLSTDIDSLKAEEGKSFQTISKSNFNNLRGQVVYSFNNIKTKLYRVSAFKFGRKVSPYIFIYSVDKTLYKKLQEEKIYALSVNKKISEITKELRGTSLRDKYYEVVYFNRDLFGVPSIRYGDSNINISVDSQALLQKNSIYLVCVVPLSKFGSNEAVSRKKVSIFSKIATFTKRDLGDNSEFLCWVEDIYGNEVSRSIYFAKDNEENKEYENLKKNELAEEVARRLSTDKNAADFRLLVDNLSNNSSITTSNMFESIIRAITNTRYINDKKLKMIQSLFEIKAVFMNKVGYINISDEIEVENQKILLSNDLNWLMYKIDLLEGTVSLVNIEKEVADDNNNRFIYALYAYDDLFFSCSKAVVFMGSKIQNMRIV